MNIYSTNKFLPINSYRRAFATSFLVILAVALAYFALPFAGLRIHFFQLAIVLSALLFGPFAGFVTGFFAAIPSALALNNYWLLLGNGIFGLCVAFYSKRLAVPLAVVAAFLTQLPYIIVTDLYVGMPMAMLQSVVLLLLFEDTLAGLLSSKLHGQIRRMLA